MLADMLTPFLDLHLLIEKVVRGKEDARRLAQAGAGGAGRVRRDVEMVSVVEVLADRWGGGEGSWGVFL